MREILEFIWQDRWDIFVMLGLIIFRKRILSALAGGNGVIQMDEIAKGLILLVFYLSFEAEAKRTDLTHTVFPENYWWAMTLGVAAIAGIKAWIEHDKLKKEHDSKE